MQKISMDHRANFEDPEKQMFRARFISGLRDFTRHFNFWYFARAAYNRNLDSLS